MDEISKKALDFAFDVTKQLITLSTAILTLSTALIGKVFSTEALSVNKTMFMLALSFFVVSIIAGMFTLLLLTGTLGDSNTTVDRSSIYRTPVRVASGLQMLFFVIALILSVVFIGCSIQGSSSAQKHSSEIKEEVDTARCIKIIKTSEYVVSGNRIDTLYIKDK